MMVLGHPERKEARESHLTHPAGRGIRYLTIELARKALRRPDRKRTGAESSGPADY